MPPKGQSLQDGLRILMFLGLQKSQGCRSWANTGSRLGVYDDCVERTMNFLWEACAQVLMGRHADFERVS